MLKKRYVVKEDTSLSNPTNDVKGKGKVQKCLKNEDLLSADTRVTLKILLLKSHFQAQQYSLNVIYKI